MRFSEHLKGQLVDFVDSYKNFFGKTLTTALACSVLCFLSIALLLHFNKDVFYGDFSQLSLQSLFWIRYSALENYYVSDLSKIFFIFFISLFSISLLRQSSLNIEEEKKYLFNTFLKNLQPFDVFVCVLALILSSFIDYLFFRLGNRPISNSVNPELNEWNYSLMYFFRVYTPLLLFSIIINIQVSKKLPRLNFKKVIFLLMSLWLFNEFASELFIFTKNYIFKLFLVPFDSESKFLFESLLGLALVAFYFVGFYSAMTFSLKRYDE